MNKLAVFTAAIAAFALGASLTYAADVEDITDGSPYYYQAPIGTQIGGATQAESQTDLRTGNAFFPTPGDTDSGINHLPVYHGNMNTNQTFRFLNIAEQVLTVIGDGKHGVWRLQDNGSVRLYITDDAEAADTGIPAGRVTAEGFTLTDLESPNKAHAFALTQSAADISASYTHFDRSASFGAPGAGGFKSFRGFNGAGATTGDGVGGIVNSDGNLAFLDVPIFHPVFATSTGANGLPYAEHRAIDLASYYCTMSGDESVDLGGGIGTRKGFDYTHARALMNFAYDQPGANVVGPLGVRAGVDIKENYPKVLRLDLFGDGRIWANTEQHAPPFSSPQPAFWQEIDTDRTLAEIYLVERPFFNEEFLFIIIVFDDRLAKGRHSYVRPAGPYFEHLVDRGLKNTFRTRIIEQPRFHVIKTTSRGKKVNGGLKKLEGFRLFGVHHPGAGLVKNVAGSGCPSVGGDFGEETYAAAWPTNYQEITPLCDGIVIDIKLYANLDGDNSNWRDENKNLANNEGSRNGVPPPVAAGEAFKNYVIDSTVQPGRDPGHYGEFTDTYLTEELGITNREEFRANEVGIPHVVNYPSANAQVKCNAHEDLDGSVADATPPIIDSCFNSHLP